MSVRPQRTAICKATFRKSLSCTHILYFSASPEPPLDDHAGMQHRDRSSTNSFDTSSTMRTMLRTMVCTLYLTPPRCFVNFSMKCFHLIVSVVVTICWRKSRTHAKVLRTGSYSRLSHMFAVSCPVTSLGKRPFANTVAARSVDKISGGLHGIVNEEQPDPSLASLANEQYFRETFVKTAQHFLKKMNTKECGNFIATRQEYVSAVIKVGIQNVAR